MAVPSAMSPTAVTQTSFVTASMAPGDLEPPSVPIPGEATPVKRIKPDELRALGGNLDRLFQQYKSDRRLAELRWLRNQRQYLGLYDTEVEQELSPNRSKAYPKLTRIKVVSTVSRLMNLMFPGNERNWRLEASPSPEMSPQDVYQAIQEAMQRDQQAGGQPVIDDDYVTAAVKSLADKRAKQLMVQIDDQLEELGGDQAYDYIALNRRVVMSGVQYGLGVLRGPFARATQKTVWSIDPQTRQPSVQVKTVYKPLFEFLPIWDFYPDMSAKTLSGMDGYFVRSVMSRSQVRKLADRQDFFSDVILGYLKTHPQGNYRAQMHEMELRAMGVKVNVNEMKSETMKYEVVIWHGPVSGEYLRLAGVDIADNRMADEIDAEIWLIDANVIKADMNPWKAMNVDIPMYHTFLFDEDDTSPIGQGLPNVMRDSQMSVAAADRMLLDNASVVCGPQLEVNTDLLRPDQDLSSVTAYKVWYREGLGPEAQYPAVRNVGIESHLEELMKVIELHMEFADAETFVGPATGGDMSKGPSEPFRTAAGASMLRGDAALPFKDIVRQFDRLTLSIINSLVWFNRKFNPETTPEADYNVIARGATSLISKEIRGIQVDQLAATLKPEEMIHVDERKFVAARFAVRDLEDLLVTEEEAGRRKDQADKAQAQQQQLQTELVEATVRKTLSDAFKNIAQGRKNDANASAQEVESAIQLLETGLKNVLGLDQETGDGRTVGQPAGPGPAGGNGAAGPPAIPGANGSAAPPGAGQQPAGFA